MRYLVAAVRNWDEDRMMNAFEYVTESGTEKQFITSRYRTLKGLIRYAIQNHPLYYSHVWAVFEIIGGTERFVGLEYNHNDEQLCEISSRYMRVRNRLQRNRFRKSPVALSLRA